MINLTSNKKHESVSVNVSPVTNINMASSTGATPYDSLATTDVKASYDDELITLRRENAALKLLIKILQSNPLIVNNFIIADDELLIEFIKTLTGAEDVQIDADDVGEGCITKNVYRKVHAIYIIKDGDTKNLKYDYPSITKQLLDLKISVKLVF